MMQRCTFLLSQELWLKNRYLQSSVFTWECLEFLLHIEQQISATVLAIIFDGFSFFVIQFLLIFLVVVFVLPYALDCLPLFLELALKEVQEAINTPAQPNKKICSSYMIISPPNVVCSKSNSTHKDYPLETKNSWMNSYMELKRLKTSLQTFQNLIVRNHLVSTKLCFL